MDRHRELDSQSQTPAIKKQRLEITRGCLKAQEIEHHLLSMVAGGWGWPETGRTQKVKTHHNALKCSLGRTLKTARLQKSENTGCPASPPPDSLFPSPFYVLCTYVSFALHPRPSRVIAASGSPEPPPTLGFEKLPQTLDCLSSF